MTPVFGRQLIDAGDQQYPFRVTRVLAPGRDLVVVVQSGGLGCGSADNRDRHLKAFGEPIEGGRAGRPGQVLCSREGVDGGAGEPAAPKALADRAGSLRLTTVRALPVEAHQLPPASPRHNRYLPVPVMALKSPPGTHSAQAPR